MLMQFRRSRPRLGLHACVATAAFSAGLGLVVSHALASPRHGFIKGREGGDGPLTAVHKAQIQACFDEARKDHPELIIHTQAVLEARSDGQVISASVPTPNSPSFQQCVEERAMEWSFPPPADASMPPPPPGARLHVMFPIMLPSAS